MSLLRNCVAHRVPFRSSTHFSKFVFFFGKSRGRGFDFSSVMCVSPVFFVRNEMNCAGMTRAIFLSHCGVRIMCVTQHCPLHSDRDATHNWELKTEGKTALHERTLRQLRNCAKDRARSAPVSRHRQTGFHRRLPRD